MMKQNNEKTWNMDRDTAELRREVEAQREAIAGTIHQIDDRVQRTTDWRAQVNEHPFIAVGIAFAVGGLLSGLLIRKRTPEQRMTEALVDRFDDLTGRVHNRLASQLRSGVSAGVLKAVGAALATKVVYALLSNTVDDERGFADRCN
jgi:ElaB/YqjD/DUF883 family membrane-anchored ribosome-binding protein